MIAWLTEMFGEQNATYILYGLGALALVLVFWILRFWTRRVSAGIFVSGGRSRKPRLAVIDAAAVDNHRRIVLVRRDDVEHLVMIGGHNELVIERDIGKGHIAEPPQREGEEAAPARKPRGAQRQSQPVAEPVAAKSMPEPAPRTEPRVAADPEPEIRVAAKRQPEPQMPEPEPLRPDSQPAAAGLLRRSEDMLAAVSRPERREPEMTIDEPAVAAEQPRIVEARYQEATMDVRDGGGENRNRDVLRPVVREARDGRLEDEMEKLLSELSEKK